MNILILGFVLGFILPFMASRFGKILPASPGAIVVRLCHCPRFPKVHNPTQVSRLRRKWLELCMAGLGWGVGMALSYYAVVFCMPEPVHFFAFLFIWIISISIVIDAKIQLLPDFFTLPLTLFGFLFADQTGAIDMSYSLAGAFFGYLISIVSVIATGGSKKAEFGAGDVKLLIALGTWLGVIGLNYAVLLSFFLFVLLSAIRGNKVGAYGPAVGIGALFAFFAIYTK